MMNRFYKIKDQWNKVKVEELDWAADEIDRILAIMEWERSDVL